MQNRVIRSIFTLAIASSLATTFVGQAAQSVGKSSGTPDFSGVWGRKPIPPPAGLARPARGSGQGAGNPDNYGFSPEVPPMTPWGLERYKQARLGKADPYEQKNEKADPDLYPYCRESGFPRDYTMPFFFRVVHAPDVMVMVFEWQRAVRQIYLDGRKHLDGAPPTSMGDSIGHWEGDTLVVETTNIDVPALLDNIGSPQSSELRVTERFRRIDRDTMQVDFTFDDPIAYTRTWTGKKLFRLLPGDTPLGEQTPCDAHSKEAYENDFKNNKLQGSP